ncbi:hypothetical protein [Nonomuraea sp. LPB2021202275-12-8]|uniref:hypothetical protein n=1 Tax=Nonomuraea sp. LPB2021202275-12-8 TaxID=3120159 RepID=UPI00300CF645
MRLVLALVLAALWAQPVHAATAGIPGLERVVGYSTIDSAQTKSARADCPFGKVVIGAGGGLSAVNPHLVLNGIKVSDTLRHVEAGGWEDENGTTANWMAFATAICADPLPGLEKVTVRSPYDSKPVKTLSTGCPDGKEILSVGWEIDSAPSQAWLSWLSVYEGRPAYGIRSRAFMSASEDQTGYDLDWWIHLHLLCAFPPPGLDWVRTGGLPDSTPYKTVEPVCPQGKRVIGVAGTMETDGARSQLGIRQLEVGSSRSAFVTASEDHDGTTDIWQLVGQAACVDT